MQKTFEIYGEKVDRNQKLKACEVIKAHNKVLELGKVLKGRSSNSSSDFVSSIQPIFLENFLASIGNHLVASDNSLV